MKGLLFLIALFGVSIVLGQNDTTQPEPEPEGEPEPEPEPVNCQVCTGEACSAAEIQKIFFSSNTHDFLTIFHLHYHFCFINRNLCNRRPLCPVQSEQYRNNGNNLY